MAATYKWIIKTTSKVDQAAKLLRIYCVLNNINPSETSLLVCAYIMVYGYTDRTKEGIIKMGIIGKPTSLKNEVYILKRMGILVGSSTTLRVAEKITKSIAEPLTDQTLLMINLDNRP